MGIVTAVVLIAALYFARVVFIPLALAILVAVILTPAVSSLERRRLPRSLAIFTVIASLICALALVGWTVFPQFVDLVRHLPGYESAIEVKIEKLKGATTGKLGNASASMKALEKEITSAPKDVGVTEDQEQSPQAGTTPSHPLSVQMVPAANPLESAEGLLGPLLTGVIVVVFAIFILAGRENLRNRMIRLVGHGRLTVMTQAMAEAWNRINRYLFMQMLVNCGYGVAIGIALHFIGVPKASLWGFGAALLRYLPYVGWPSAALMPSALALAVFPGWGHAILTACTFAGLEFIVANGVEPLLYGSHIGLAPLAILVSAVFWTLLWGFPGLLLSTPMTVCLVVVGRYVPSLEFLNILLGNEPVMDAYAKFYQRLLAGDEEEARQILEEHLSHSTLQDLYDAVVIPALARSEQDRHRNDLDEETRSFINTATRELVEEIADAAPADTPQEAPVAANGGEQARESYVVCVPARDEADEVAGMMLCQLLERRGIHAQSLPAAPVADMLEKIGQMGPEGVCVSALPPLSMSHTRNLCAKLRRQFPNMHLVVCLWQWEGDPRNAANMLKLAPRDSLFSRVPDVLKFFAGAEEDAAPEVPHEVHPA